MFLFGFLELLGSFFWGGFHTSGLSLYFGYCAFENNFAVFSLLFFLLPFFSSNCSFLLQIARVTNKNPSNSHFSH